MKNFFPILLFFFQIAASAAVTTPYASLEQRDGILLLKDADPASEWKTARLTFFLLNGKTGKEYLLGAPEILADSKDVMKVCWTKPDFRWEITFSARGRTLLGVSSFTNRTGQELWIEPSAQLSSSAFASAPLVFWDGFEKLRKLEGKPLAREGIKGSMLKHIASASITFPAVSLSGKTSQFYLGSRIFEPVSYSAASADPTRGSLKYSTRFVLSPGETLTFNTVLGSASAVYGAADAVVQRYYDSFPEDWAVVQGQDNPYIWENLAHYANWWEVPNEEKSRRLYTSIEWCYCPYKRSGDIRGRSELWDYETYSPLKDKSAQTPKYGGTRFGFKDLSREDFLKLRRAAFLKYGRQFGWMFYNTCSGTWCEYNLALQKYPDAVNYDKTISHILNAWSTGHDREIRVFPMGTTFAKILEEDMTYLASELDLPGFALDCGNGGAFYRGPACRKPLPGRAWDKDGVFIDQGVAINHEIDFIHNIRKNPADKLTVFNNGTLKGDILMVERPFLNKAEFSSILAVGRWYIGPRPAAVHAHGFMLRDIVPDWRSKNKDFFCDLIPKLADYMLLNQFKYGLTNSYVAFYGNPQLLYILPELFELARAGWQSENPFVFSKELYVPYRSRFGKGANSFFFFANSSPTDSGGTVSIDNGTISSTGTERYVLLRKMRKSAWTENRINGKFTELDLFLPSRVPVLYETVFGFVSAPEKMKLQAGSAKYLRSQVFQVDLTETPSFHSGIILRNIRGFQLTKVELNGKAVPTKSQGDFHMTPPLSLGKGDKLLFHYESDVFRLSREDILLFPFTDPAGELTFRIFTDKNDIAAQNSAKAFERYFEFCRKNGVLGKGTVSPEMTHSVSDSGKSGVIVLRTGKELKKSVSASATGGLQIQAENEKELDGVLKSLFYVMDERYSYIFPFKGVMGLYDNMLIHFGMLGKSFPVRKYFD